MVTLATNYDRVYNFIGVWVVLLPVLSAISFQLYYRLLRAGTTAPGSGRPVHFATLAYLVLNIPLGVACLLLTQAWLRPSRFFESSQEEIAALVCVFPFSAILAATLWYDTKSLLAALGPVAAAAAFAVTLYIMITDWWAKDLVPRWPIVPAYIAWHAVCAASLALFARPAWIKLGRDTSHLCGRCGYNLRGLRSSTCPECGPPIPKPPAATPT